MKRIILLFLFLLSAFAMSYAQDSIPTATTDSVSSVAKGVEDNNVQTNDPAIAAYNEGLFRETIEILEKEKETQLANGKESAELYYNLGNAYFRVNDLAHARLNYERALLLDPGDRDTRHNIEYMMTRIEDKILVADTFFLNTWVRVVQNLFSSNAWAIIGAVLFIIFILSLVVFFFTRNIIAKKSAFYAGIVSILIVLLANVFAFKQKGKIEHRDTAVIMVGSVSVLSSPDINSKELFILHSGTKVEITKEDRNWYEIEVDNGSVGWVQKEKLGVI